MAQGLTSSSGLGGIDSIDARGGNDLICAGGGDDDIKAGAGDDKVMGQGGIEDVWGGRGQDLAMLVDSPRGVEADLRTGSVTGHGRDRVISIETVYGSVFDDVLYGDDEANTLAGGPGDDQVHGLGGNDRLRSGQGGADLLDGGEGLDAANYFLSWDPVHADLAAGQAVTSGVDTLVGINNLVGSKYDDTLIGNDDDNLRRDGLRRRLLSVAARRPSPKCRHAMFIGSPSVTIRLVHRTVLYIPSRP